MLYNDNINVLFFFFFKSIANSKIMSFCSERSKSVGAPSKSAIRKLSFRIDRKRQASEPFKSTDDATKNEEEGSKWL